MEVNAQYVIDSLLEQNSQLTMQIAMLQAAIKTIEESDQSGAD
jgi:hypothetical protein